MAKESYWFKHDHHARSDRKMMNLLMTTGVTGIGIYWCIVEMLYEEGGYLMQSECERIAFELRTDCNTVTKVIQSSLFDRDNEKFWSESVLRRLGKRKEKSDKNANNAKKRWEDERKKKENDANEMRTHSNGNANDMLRREEKKREDILTSNYNPPIPAQFEKQGVVHDMIGVWERYFPDHTEDENEFGIILKIAYKIAKDNEWKKDDVISLKRKETVDIWDKYVRFIQNDAHFCRLQISTIHGQWNGLKQTIAAEKKKREEVLQKTTTTILVPHSIVTHMTDADRSKYKKTTSYVQNDTSLR